MFGTGIEFSGLPSELQYAAIAGVFIGGAIYAYVMGKKARPPAEPAKPALDDASQEVIRLAAQLADEKVRADLRTVIESARDALHTRIDALAASIRDDLRDADRKNSEARNTIYDRINALERAAQGHHVDIERLKQRRPVARNG